MVQRVDLVINNGFVVSPTETTNASIAVKNQKIVAIGDKSTMPASDEVIDAKGKYVLPGIIEPHTHLSQGAGMLQDAVKTQKDNFITETRSAAVGGITTTMTDIRWPGSPLLGTYFDKVKEDYEQRGYIDVVFHCIILGKHHIREIPDCVEKMGISSFKFLMAYKGREAATINITGAEPMDNGMMFDAFRTIKQVGPPALAMVHCEDIEIFFYLADQLIAQGRQDLAAYTESRPDFVEELGIRVALFIQQLVGVPMYIVHLGVGEGVDLVAEAKARGQKVYAETCPHYLNLTKDLQGFGKLAKLNPSLKDKADNEKLWWGIQHGIIDNMGTDHCALTKELKDQMGDMWKTVPGFPGTATMLPMMLSEGVNKRRISINKLVEVLSTNTAKIFGIYPKKGAIQVGSDADFTIVDLKKREKVTPELLQSRSDYSLYDGWVFKGWPIMTIVRGNVVMKDFQVIGKQGFGRYVPRPKPAKSRK